MSSKKLAPASPLASLLPSSSCSSPPAPLDSLLALLATSSNFPHPPFKTVARRRLLPLIMARRHAASLLPKWHHDPALLKLVKSPLTNTIVGTLSRAVGSEVMVY